MEAVALVASVNAKDFLNNKHFTEEVFGPYSLAIICDDEAQLIQCLQNLKGQLTSTIMATEKDIEEYSRCNRIATYTCRKNFIKQCANRR